MGSRHGIGEPEGNEVPFDEAVAGFRNLYRLVHQKVEGRVEVLIAHKDDSAKALRELNDTFFHRFEQWEHNEPLRPYLRCFMKKRQSKLLRVSAFMFLHVAHDMPLSIKEVIDKCSVSERCQLRHAYLNLAELFPTTFRESAKQGHFGFFGRFLGWPQAFVNTLIQWVLALRSQAWMVAEILVDQESDDVPQLISESRLRDWVLMKGEETKHLLDLPILGIGVEKTTFSIGFVALGVFLAEGVVVDSIENLPPVIIGATNLPSWLKVTTAFSLIGYALAHAWIRIRQWFATRGQIFDELTLGDINVEPKQLKDSDSTKQGDDASKS